MIEYAYRPATQQDIPFIAVTYEENINSLHGNHRDCATWHKLLSEQSSEYYVVHQNTPLAWFRVDMENGELWLGMLQVSKAHQRRGIGKYILSVVEAMAKERGISTVGIHTTEDNTAAQGLYAWAGYTVTEIGPCTTADGVDRVGYTFQKQI